MVISESMTLPGDESLYARLWSRGDGRDLGVVILVHGLGDHGGRYQSFARRMIQRRWAVFAVDLPGHGRSPGRRGTAKSYDTILRIISSARMLMRDTLGDVHQFLLGHSMGGNFAVNYVLRKGEFDPQAMPDPSGLLLIAPMMMPPSFLDRSQIFAAWGTGQLFRWIRISKPARIEQLTRDEEVGQQIQADPLQHSHISLYLATQLLAQGRFALDRASAINIPSLVIHGDEDELIDQAACRNLALRMGNQGNFKRWPGGRHDLLNDIDADSVADELARWMEQKSQPAATQVRLVQPTMLSGDPSAAVMQ